MYRLDDCTDQDVTIDLVLYTGVNLTPFPTFLVFCFFLFLAEIKFVVRSFSRYANLFHLPSSRSVILEACIPSVDDVIGFQLRVAAKIAYLTQSHFLIMCHVDIV